jgi:hypothetical protein
MLTYEDKQKILTTHVRNSNMDVPFKKCRFPMIDGIQQKITLISSLTGTFMNIGFVQGVNNTINGNIADALMDAYPDVFKVIKVNGVLVEQGKKMTEREQIKEELLDSLKKEFEIVPKKSSTPSSRDRIEEKELLNTPLQNPSTEKTSNYKK